MSRLPAPWPLPTCSLSVTVAPWIIRPIWTREFAEAIQFVGFTEEELCQSYDAVFHLVTAAKGAEAHYTTANNLARTETVQEAAALDDRLIAAWAAHPHLRVIDNSSCFEEKMNRLVHEIALFLGQPEAQGK